MQSPVNDSFQSDEKYRDSQPSVPSLTDNRPMPERKYSAVWFKKTWDAAVRVGTLPRLIYGGVVIVLIIIWIGVMLAFTSSQISYEKQNAGETPTRRRQDNNTKSGALGLKGSFVKFDPTSRALTVTWSGLYKMSPESSWTQLGNRDDQNSTIWPIHIYRDVSSSKTAYVYNATGPDGNTTTETTGWMYSVDNTTAKPIAGLGYHPWDSFDTDISFSQLKVQDVWAAPLMGYPFDKWAGSIVFVANDPLWASIDNVTGGDVLELATVQMTDSTLNWRFTYEFNNTCASDHIQDYHDESTFNEGCHLKIDFIGSRPPVVVFAAVSAVIVNWTSALFIFILTCEAIVLRRKYMLDGTDILSVCFTALFALPTIRSLLPGAPEYGMILDLVGVLPCTILIALCTVAVAVAKLNKRRKEENKDE